MELNRLAGIYGYDDQRAQNLGGGAPVGTTARQPGGGDRRAGGGAAAERGRRVDLRRLVLDRALDGGTAAPGAGCRRAGALTRLHAATSRQTPSRQPRRAD